MPIWIVSVADLNPERWSNRKHVPGTKRVFLGYKRVHNFGCWIRYSCGLLVMLTKNSSVVCSQSHILRSLVSNHTSGLPLPSGADGHITLEVEALFSWEGAVRYRFFISSECRNSFTSPCSYGGNDFPITICMYLEFIETCFQKGTTAATIL